jgi:hypothetical protein
MNRQHRYDCVFGVVVLRAQCAVLGAVVLLEAEAEDEEGREAAFLFGLVQCMWEDEDGEALAQVGRNSWLWRTPRAAS